MPKGVEHVLSEIEAAVRMRVQLSVMPKGVEHLRAEVATAGGMGATISDAERR